MNASSIERELPFSMSEFIRRPDLGVPVDVQDKILKYHLYPLSHVRWEIEAPVIISMRSSFRHIKHEREKNRTGNSEHTFTGLGASDITSPAFKDLLKTLVAFQTYERLILYPDNNFVHGDYAKRGGKYGVQNAGASLKWVSQQEFMNIINQI